MSPSPSRRQFLRSAGRGAVALALAPRFVFSQTARSATASVRIERACLTMGSTLHITAYGDERGQVIQAISAAFAEVDRLDRLLSVYRSDSPVSRINRAAGREPVKVPRDVLDVVNLAVDFSGRLGGTFDITVEPLMRAWGFRDSVPPAPPGDAALRALLEATGSHQLIIDRSRRTVGLLPAAGAIDLGGIGVGFALDRAAAVLRRHGIENAFLNHSGDVVAMGSNGREPWRVGIPDPTDPRRFCLCLDLADRAVSTSGSYENHRRLAGTLYGHLLSPRTGRPADEHLGVTVIAASSTVADVLSTALACGTSPEQLPAIDATAQAIVFDSTPRGVRSTRYRACGAPGSPARKHDNPDLTIIDHTLEACHESPSAPALSDPGRSVPPR